jgi:pyruvate formate lyase activating enzyme
VSALKRRRDTGIHTTVDTSGYVAGKTLARMSGMVDLFLYDLKLMDRKKHKLHTGVSNKPIIENLKMLDTLGMHTVIRFPLTPRVNNSEANITNMCELLSGLKNIEGISILPITDSELKPRGRGRLHARATYPKLFNKLQRAVSTLAL